MVCPQDVKKMLLKQAKKEDWKWQRGITAHLLSESNWRKSHLSVRKWESLNSTEADACQSKASGYWMSKNWMSKNWMYS